MNNIGVMYENGWGVEADSELAISWYKLSALYGFPMARTNLAKLGAPIPPADLEQRPQYSDEEIALMFGLLGPTSNGGCSSLTIGAVTNTKC